MLNSLGGAGAGAKPEEEVLLPLAELGEVEVESRAEAPPQVVVAQRLLVRRSARDQRVPLLPGTSAAADQVSGISASGGGVRRRKA